MVTWVKLAERLELHAGTTSLDLFVGEQLGLVDYPPCHVRVTVSPVDLCTSVDPLSAMLNALSVLVSSWDRGW